MAEPVSEDMAAAVDATRRIQSWCAGHNTICLVTPMGRYWVVLFDPDGEGPLPHYFGSSAVEVAQRLERRGSALYGVNHCQDPVDLERFL